MLRHMYPDNHGNLYISKTIAVFDMKGNILNTFNRVQNEVELLKQAWMVHVFDGHYVYVADWELKKTVVFTEDGKYIMDHCTLITMVWCFTVTAMLICVSIY